MAETRGLVSCLYVGENFGFTSIVFPITLGGINNQDESFILWWHGVSTPSNPDQNLLATHDRWLDMLRSAMADNSEVTISHPPNSAIVQSLRVG